MAFPPPIEGASAERLYKEAKFFYDQYERVKVENTRLRRIEEAADVLALVALIETHDGEWDAELDAEYSTKVKGHPSILRAAKDYRAAKEPKATEQEEQ